MECSISKKNQKATGNVSRVLQNAHQETLEELERYKLLVENVQDYAIFFMDASGYIRTWNKGAEKTKGYRPSEIIGKHFSIFYPSEDILDKKPERELEIAKKVGRIEDEDWRVRKDGSKFWANVVITALYDTDGKLQGFAKVTRDLTERKEHEDSLRMANILLQEQQKELRRLNESKDEFISLASHQLRTPATAIKQLLGLLIEGFEAPLPENLMRIIQKTYESNERQIMIVNSLLRVAQIDAGKIVLRKKLCDINTVIDSLIKQYEGMIRDKNQTIRYSLPIGPLVGCVDEQYYRMALENILDNASKYTKEGGEIKISSGACDNLAHVAIQDTGVGISPEDIPLLFEKFHRIPNDMSHTTAGSGLGLYWVEKVIDLHQGRLDVESQPGKGTTFHIFVPLGG
jgi:PAS domain S-box-containing protein